MKETVAVRDAICLVICRVLSSVFHVRITSFTWYNDTPWQTFVSIHFTYSGTQWFYSVITLLLDTTDNCQVYTK